ncbi:hypothetical protein C8F01DRAFT_1294284 [Mycena amicta]|nr:hypothetical protein C8F01DRAFT_1294284 [Mycena amicta]
MPRVKSSSGKSRARAAAGKENSKKRWETEKENEHPHPPTPRTPSSPKSTKIQNLQKKIRAVSAAHTKLIHDYELAVRREKRLRRDLKAKDVDIQNAATELQEERTKAQKEIYKALQDGFQRKQAFEDQLTQAQKHVRIALQRADNAEEQTGVNGAELAECRRRLRGLNGQLQRYAALKETLRTGNQKEKATVKARLKKGRAYKHEIRALTRILMSCGCKQGRVGEVVQQVAGAFGINLDQVLSRRTVGRIALEGLVMARMQLGFELKQTQGEHDSR